MPAMRLVGHQHVAQFAAETRAALHHLAAGDHAAAQAGADDGRDRCRLAVSAEDVEVAPQRAGVAVVQIGDGLAQLLSPGRRGYRSRPSRRWTKLVEPRALSTPVALAGPGVSSPTTTISSMAMPAVAAASSGPRRSAARQISGPSFDTRRVLA